MISNWREVHLEDVADELTVGFVGSMASEYVNNEIPFLRSLNIEPYGIKKKDLKYVSTEFHKKIKKSRLTPGDVVIVRTGRPGACTVIPDWMEEANCSDLVIIRPGKELDSHFLAAYINIIATQYIDSHLVGAVQQHFNVGSAKKIKISLPPLSEQKRIAKIIKDLNEKIEIHNALRKNLEEIAQTLFKRWFIDFEFPNEDGEPYKSSGGKMKESDEGLIPQNWHLDTLPNISTVIYGKAFKSAYFNKDKEGMPLIRIRNISDDFSDIYTTEDYEERYLINEKDILIGMDGEFNVSLWKGDPSVQNQRVLKINTISLPQLYLYLALKRPIEEIEFGKVGTTVIHLSKKDIDSIKIWIPDIRVINLITKTFEEIIDLIVLQEKESTKLKEMRDTLIPKLLSGEIEISEEIEVINHVSVY